MSGKWSQPDIPHKGWSCVDIEDLGEPSATCEMCETMTIRYVHYMTHPEYADELRCGCICAGHMEENYNAARERERQLRKNSDKRRRWARSPRWMLSRVGNEFLDRDGYRVVIFRGPEGSWSFQVINLATAIKTTARRLYPTETAAKLTSFDAILWCRDHRR